MTPVHYSYRPSIFSRERTFRLDSDAIVWTRGNSAGRVAFGEVAEVRLYRHFMPGADAVQKKIMWRVHLRSHAGELLALSPLHCLRFRKWEDRSEQYLDFANRLLSDLRQRYPNIPVVAKSHWTVRWRFAVRRKAAAQGGRVLVWLFHALRSSDPDRVINCVARLMRLVGPMLRAHRVARENLKAAFPEKSSVEIDAILRGMWDNIGRVIAEYPYLDRLWVFNPNNARPGRIVLDQAMLERAAFARSSNKPMLVFAGHLANWELPAVAAAALGVKCALVYRPPNLGLAKIIDIRSRLMGTLIPAGPGAARKLRQALDRGMSVAMLLDQHYGRGVDVTFFGRRCKVNPTMARLANLFDCMIYGAHMVRLPGNRYRGEVTDLLEPPRDANGKVDVAATMQMITTIIEGWVREHPEQWLWMHRRWR